MSTLSVSCCNRCPFHTEKAGHGDTSHHCSNPDYKHPPEQAEWYKNHPGNTEYTTQLLFERCPLKTESITVTLGTPVYEPAVTAPGQYASTTGLKH